MLMSEHFFVFSLLLLVVLNGTTRWYPIQSNIFSCWKRIIWIPGPLPALNCLFHFLLNPPPLVLSSRVRNLKSGRMDDVEGWMELVSISLLTLAENCRRLLAKNNRQHDRMPPIYPVAIHHPNCEVFIQCGSHNKQKGNPCYYKAHGRWNIWEAILTTSVKYMIRNWGQGFRLHF